jgi:hypothetical protein
VFVTISGPDAGRVGHRGLRIVNNWFDTPWDESGPGSATRARSGAVALSWCESSPQGYDDVLIGFNSFHATTGIELEAAPPGCRFEDVRVVGNLMAWDGCEPRWAYAHNVWSDALRSGTCDPTDRIAGPSFPYKRAASGPGLDFHLARPVATVPEGCPALDVDGARRPARGCAAGSDEPG